MDPMKAQAIEDATEATLQQLRSLGFNPSHQRIAELRDLLAAFVTVLTDDERFGQI